MCCDSGGVAGLFCCINAQRVWECTNQRRAMEAGKESYSNPLFAVCWPCGFALVLLGLLRARWHGLLSFLISSAWSCPPDWWASRPLHEQKWLAITFEQDFAQPPVMIFPTVFFWNGREAFVNSAPHLCLTAAWSIGLYHEKSALGPKQSSECLWLCWNLKNAALPGSIWRYKKPRVIWIH